MKESDDYACAKSKTYSLKSGLLNKKDMMDKKYQVLG